MTQSSESKTSDLPETKGVISKIKGKIEAIKFRFLALGLIVMLIAILIMQFFIDLRYPPARFLPQDLQPEWLKDNELRSFMFFWGDIGIIMGWIVLLFGIFLTIYGLVQRFRSTVRIPRKFEQSIEETFIYELKTDKNFLLLFIATIIFGILWIFNILTYPSYGPLYYLRKIALRAYFPDVPDESLPSLSTYGLFAVIQDTAILLIYLYTIYVTLRPGKQFGEDFVSFALERTLFLSVLMITSIVHAIGHMPFELYNRGQWGSGYSSIEAWISFDKILHMMASMAITMLFFAIITEQFTKYGHESTNSDLYALLIAISFMVSLGVAWEIYEWITNALLNLGHFIDEILDAPKDLVWDAIGAVLGAIFAFIELQQTKTSQKNN